MQITSSIIVLASYKLPKCDAESIYLQDLYSLPLRGYTQHCGCRRGRHPQMPAPPPLMTDSAASRALPLATHFLVNSFLDTCTSSPSSTYE